MTLGVENIPHIAQIASKSRMLCPKGELGNSGLTCPLTGQPVKSGVVYAVQSVPGGRQVKVRVVLNVYVSNFGRYAVVSQEKAICRDCGFINLKHCTVKTLDKTSNKDSTTNGLYSFQIIARNAEGQTMTFCVTSQSDVEQWVQTLKGSDTEGSEGWPLAGKESRIGNRIPPPCRRPLSQLSPLKGAPPQMSRKSQSVLPVLEEE